MFTLKQNGEVLTHVLCSRLLSSEFYSNTVISSSESTTFSHPVYSPADHFEGLLDEPSTVFEVNFINQDLQFSAKCPPEMNPKMCALEKEATVCFFFSSGFS